MTDAVVSPTKPDAAQARLTELTGNAEWSTKLLGNDPVARGEFDALSKVIAGEAPQFAEGSAEAMALESSKASAGRDLSSFIRGAQAHFPISDAVIAQIAAGQPISKADQDLGKNWIAQIQNDPERSAKLLKGDAEIKRQMFHASVLANSDLIEEKAK
jgi:hypothetical protein